MFGGMWVFPGGQIDPGDTEEARPGTAEGTGEQPLLDAARRAAVREAEEEAGIALDEDSLVVLSFWLPPQGAPRRFATWFFLAPAHESGDVVVDNDEIHEHRWISPLEAMRLRDAGQIGLVPPTFFTLWWLSQQPDTASALAAAAARPPEKFETHMAAGSAGTPRAALWAGDVGYEDGDTERPGPRRRLVMDDPAGWRVEIQP
jgi:8-oxo-dGTP pyrophosphatase MutT (NUDIX family)